MSPSRAGLLPALRGWESDAPDISGVRLPPNYSHLESIRDEIDFDESTRVDAVRCLNPERIGSIFVVFKYDDAVCSMTDYQLIP